MPYVGNGPVLRLTGANFLLNTIHEALDAVGPGVVVIDGRRGPNCANVPKRGKAAIIVIGLYIFAHPVNGRRPVFKLFS